MGGAESSGRSEARFEPAPSPSVRPPLVTSDCPPPVRSTSAPRSVAPSGDGAGSNRASHRPLDSAPPIPYQPGRPLPEHPVAGAHHHTPGPVMQRRNRRLPRHVGSGGARRAALQSWRARLAETREDVPLRRAIALNTRLALAPTGAARPLLLLLDDVSTCAAAHGTHGTARSTLRATLSGRSPSPNPPRGLTFLDATLSQPLWAAARDRGRRRVPAGPRIQHLRRSHSRVSPGRSSGVSSGAFAKTDTAFFLLHAQGRPRERRPFDS